MTARIVILSSSDIARCPIRSLAAEHYRDDGTCRCGEVCEMEFDGLDTNGDEWHRCTIHDELVLGDAYVCEGYHAPAYVEMVHSSGGDPHPPHPDCEADGCYEAGGEVPC